MPSLELRLEDWDPYKYSIKDFADELSAKVFHILNDYLQPDTEMPLFSAVKSILDILPGAPLSDEIYVVGEIVLELAKQIPYHHPSQAKLARVMEGLTNSPKFTTGPYSSGQSMRGQRFRESIREAYNGPSAEYPQVWPNLMAFYAHISSMHVLGHDPTYAIWTMRGAFEERPVPWDPPFEGERDQRIIAAAQYILWDGLELFKEVVSPGTIEERPSWMPGLLCFSEHRLSLRRWHFWKKGFEKSREEGNGLSEECRKVAGKAAALMETIEEGLSF
ncbi:hypothetical protein BO94DRAFT_620264 [Aspergillus sclerotioniger CBS 115572]|uniref:Uncharacterized protein n=1 Tax=Aspergillus sclerotioniger CBS 115572 TaxID=1450535 RepID=A0A317XBI4_9EURO|nr:hypothetical protein BO94DRAFT_620264 [Aspergillus sclerotioniger CBS 115572]PWY95903.1 hypothetical protein BO94DRAFT_620264 [Aspergillus sclerotioniger CBS 115572]